jgi:hypothetical protein
VHAKPFPPPFFVSSPPIYRRHQTHSEPGDSDTLKRMSRRHDILISLLASETLPTSLLSTEYAEYLDQLLSSSLETLKHEPITLSEKVNNTRGELHRLARKDYSEFLQTHQMKESLASDLSQVSTSLADLSVEKLEETSRKFVENSQDTQKSLGNVKAHLPEILDLLQLPLLLDSLIRSQNYDSVLDLLHHINRLATRHGKIAIVGQIQKLAEGSRAEMIKQLISGLRDGKLASTMRFIGLLRRLGLSEVDLRILFLKQRDLSLMSSLPVSSVKYSEWTESTEWPLDLQHKKEVSGDALAMAKNWIETSRTHLFDIITQYRTIFSDSETTTMSLLSSYVVHHVSLLVNTVGDCVRQTRDVGGISSLLNQVMYYGLSLARIGIDFRLLVHPAFEDSLMALSGAVFDAVEESWKENLSRDMLKPVSAPLLSLSTPTTPRAANFDAALFTPPAMVGEYPILTSISNSIFSFYNSLRIFAPVSLKLDLSSTLKDTLMRIQSVGEAYLEDEKSEEARRFKKAFNAMKDSLMNALDRGVYGGLN